MQNFKCFLIVPWLFSISVTEVPIEKRKELLADLIKYYNHLPNKNYTACNGYLGSVREIDDTVYNIQVTLNTQGNTRHIKCFATVLDLGDEGVSFMNNDVHCTEEQPTYADKIYRSQPVEVPELRMPIQLADEIEVNTMISPGEHYIAIPTPPCLGCSHHVHPNAPGVSDLANMLVKHLDLYEPNIKHTLNSVLEVEVHVINGIKYSLILAIDFDDCADTKTNECFATKTCKVSILVRSWHILPNGHKYRKILANNCTDAMFDNDGEHFLDISDNETNNEKKLFRNKDDVEVKQHDNAPSQKNKNRILTTEEISAIDDQILPHNNLRETAELLADSTTVSNSRRLYKSGALNPNDPQNLVLAEESLQKYLRDSGIQRPHHVVRVTHLVNTGSITSVSFVAAPIDNDDDGELTCYSKLWINVGININRIDVSCSAASIRAKRDNEPGGVIEKNPKEAKYLALAQESLEKYVRENGTPRSLKVARVEKVTTQVVAGLLTKISFAAVPADNTGDSELNCYSEILEQVWLNKKDIHVSCEIRSRRKNEPGGIEVKDSNDLQYLILAEESLQKYLRDRGEQRPHVILRVRNVTTQVVAGFITRICFIAAPADNAGDSELICNSEIWEQDWIHKKDINVTCSTRFGRVKREIADGSHKQNTMEINDVKQNGLNKYPLHSKNVEIEEDATNPEYKLLAAQALRKYSRRSGILHKLVEVENVTKRVDTSLIYNIKFSASPTKCFANVSNERALNCEVIEHINVFCNAHIWDQPWIRKIKINVRCSSTDEADYQDNSVDDSGKENSSVDETNRNSQKSLDPKIYALAEEALEQYMSVSNKTYYYRITAILDFEKHKVDGIFSNIVFTISPTVCLRNVYIDSIANCELKKPRLLYTCNAKIYEQSWLGAKKDIKINCKKILNNKIKHKKRPKRHIIKSNTKLDKDLAYYYADQVLNEVNERFKGNKLFKLVRIHIVLSKVQEKAAFIKMYIEIANDLVRSTCLAKVYPSPNDKYVINNITVACDETEADLDIDVRSDKFKLVEPSNNELVKGKVSVRDIDKNIGKRELSNILLNKILKHVEAKYPRTHKQKLVRVLSFNKVLANVRYRLKVEVGITNCTALSNQTACELENAGNSFCRIDMWLDKSSDRPPLYRVNCTTDPDVNVETQAEYLFNKLLETYKPNYVNDEKERRNRFEIFKINIRRIHNMNVFEKASARYGITKFADLTYEEFSSRYTGFKPSLTNVKHSIMKAADIPNTKLPPSFDWREYGAVTNVKDQGACSSSWAFSAIGNIESQIQIRTKKLLTLSEDRLMECDKLNRGCDGGLPENAYRSIKEIGANQCLSNKSDVNVKVSGAVGISNEEDMMKWLVQNGPISIGVNAAPLQFYLGGVIHLKDYLCSKTNLDHSVLIVGYGLENHPLYKKKVPYWIIKNSWGEEWGERGYYRQFLGDGTCGIDKMATSAVINT